MQIYCVRLAIGSFSLPMVFLRPFYAILLIFNGILALPAQELSGVVSSFTIPNEWVGRLTGGKMPHLALLPAGSELHGYQISPLDARALAKAKLIVGINPELEPWLADWVKANRRETAMLWISPGTRQSGSHTWIVPAEVRQMLALLAARLKSDPAIGILVTESNINQILSEVNAVDNELRDLFAKLPPSRRAFITQHPGIEGFAASYGLRVAGTILDSSTAESADPSARHYAELVQRVKTERIGVITCDAGQSHSFADRLAHDANLPPPTELGFEFLQRPGTPGDSWASMMRLNAQRLYAALQNK